MWLIDSKQGILTGCRIASTEIIEDSFQSIPKYIEKKIKSIDTTYPVRGRTHFYAYLTKNNGELVKITVAVKEKKNKWCCKQVAVHGVHSDKCFVKDMGFTYIGGYSVGWHAEGLTSYKPWYEDGYWGWTNDKLFDPYAPIVNSEYILEKFPEYKYSAIDRYMGIQLFKYLRLYEKYPQIEYLTKLGLQRLAFSTQILRLCGKDKKFRKWIANNRQDIIRSSYYISSIIKAYKTSGSINSIYPSFLTTSDKTMVPLAVFLSSKAKAVAGLVTIQQTIKTNIKTTKIKYNFVI